MSNIKKMSIIIGITLIAVAIFYSALIYFVSLGIEPNYPKLPIESKKR